MASLKKAAKPWKILALSRNVLHGKPQLAHFPCSYWVSACRTVIVSPHRDHGRLVGGNCLNFDNVTLHSPSSILCREAPLPTFPLLLPSFLYYPPNTFPLGKRRRGKPKHWSLKKAFKFSYLLILKGKKSIGHILHPFKSCPTTEILLISKSEKPSVNTQKLCEHD